MTDLAERYQALRRDVGFIRVRDAAHRLGTTEAALVAAGVTGEAVPLRPDWPALFQSLPRLGRVLALTRNEYAVSERQGAYGEVTVGPAAITVRGPEIDLRLFTGNWAHGFALSGKMPAIQIFDRDGEAVHKVFALAQETDQTAWAELVARFADPGQPAPPEQPGTAPPALDAAALPGADWLALADPTSLTGLAGGLTPAAEGAALRLDPAAAARTALTLAAERQVPIRITVANRSAVQISSGLVHRLQPSAGGWFNVLDPQFNLHLLESGVATAWQVSRATADGPETAIELLDAGGRLVVQFLGARQAGQPEDEAWHAIATAVAGRHALQAPAA